MAKRMDFNTYYQQLLAASTTSPPRRKCFISYYSADLLAAQKFIKDFGDVFIPKEIGITDSDDFIDSMDADYVMGRIRATHLDDSTVTICLIGNCTHSRRYIDWEIKSSLRRGNYTPNGVLAILLPHLGTSGFLPERIKANYDTDSDNSYVVFKSYPNSQHDLRSWIEQAFEKRTSKASLIKNSQDMMRYNGKCKIHAVTH